MSKQVEYQIEISEGMNCVLIFKTSYDPKRGNKNGKIENEIVLEKLIEKNIKDGKYTVSIKSRTSAAYLEVRRKYNITLTTDETHKKLKYILTHSCIDKNSRVGCGGTVTEPIIRSFIPTILPPFIPPPITIPLFPIDIPDPTIYDIDTYRIT